MTPLTKEQKNLIAQDMMLRALEFLRESNLIEGIQNIDYSLPQMQMPDMGHFGAFLEAHQLAVNHQPITLETLCRWQKWIATEQLQFGHSISKKAIGAIRSSDMPINIKLEGYTSPDYSKVPELIHTLIESLNKRLSALKEDKDEVLLASILGDTYQKFEAMHPFVECNGRVGRLLANYIVMVFSYPLIIFKASERPDFIAIHQSEKSMRCYMGKKIQEAIFSEEGRILQLRENYGYSATYHNPMIRDSEILTVEWHKLNSAMNQWQQESQNKHN